MRARSISPEGCASCLADQVRTRRWITCASRSATRLRRHPCGRRLGPARRRLRHSGATTPPGTDGPDVRAGRQRAGCCGRSPARSSVGGARGAPRRVPGARAPCGCGGSAAPSVSHPGAVRQSAPAAAATRRIAVPTSPSPLPRRIPMPGSRCRCRCRPMSRRTGRRILRPARSTCRSRAPGRPDVSTGRLYRAAPCPARC